LAAVHDVTGSMYRWLGACQGLTALGIACAQVGRGTQWSQPVPAHATAIRAQGGRGTRSLHTLKSSGSGFWVEKRHQLAKLVSDVLDLVSPVGRSFLMEDGGSLPSLCQPFVGERT